MIEKVIEFSAKNKFLVFALIFFGVLWGIYSLRQVPLDAIPDLSDAQVIIYTEWMGRNPYIMEDQVTYPIAAKMLGAPKVKVVRGYSGFGQSYVYVIFRDGTDLYWARSRVLEYLSQVQGQLPRGVNPILGPDATGVGWVFQYALVDTTGTNDLQELRSYNDWYLRYAIQSVPGVAEVASVGGFVKEYQVDIDPTRLQTFNLSLPQVIAAIKANNKDVGGRSIEMSGREYMIRGLGYIKSIEDVKKIAVGTDGRGTPIFLQDIGFVHLGTNMRRGIAELDGRGEVVGGIVVMRYGENALNVIKRVKERIEELIPSLPQGVKIITTYDRSELIHRSIETLTRTLIEESIIVILVILIFLFHFKSSFVAILTLPVAIILSFIPMLFLKVTSNIMSLGGIAIAIGAMVDSSIIMIENAHKWLERHPGQISKAERDKYLIEAAKQVGKPLFFALLVITVSFLPIFTLEAQEGRLFKPLAYTKTFAMFFGALLAVTLSPALMLVLIKGKIRKEEDNPVSRVLIKSYEPFVQKVLKRPVLTVSLAFILVVSTIPIFLSLGSEFMPPLNEGSILYMPTTLPGLSVTEATRLLQTQDRLLRTFPEVERVFGKIGRAETPTDPAPLSMVETTVLLKDKKFWRKGLTWDRLIEELDQKLQFPGVPNIWTMPIKNRIDMLTTGIKSPVGIKIYGGNLDSLQAIGQRIEALINPIKGTRSVYAERVMGASYLDIKIKREEIARLGLNVDDINMVIESAIGGEPLTQTVEGRERYTVSVRYGRELRDDVEKLKRVLVPISLGGERKTSSLTSAMEMGMGQAKEMSRSGHVLLGQVADFKIRMGPDMIRSERGMLTGWVFVDIKDRDIGSYVKEAKEVLKKNLKFPSGYSLSFSGQYEFLERAQARLKLILPLTFFIIFFILYLNTRSLTKVFIVFLAVPFSLIGAIFLMKILGYNLSVAVWAGIIALAGLDAETGVVMLLYLDLAYEEWKSRGKMKTVADLNEAIIHGAVKRIRPKTMTVAAILLSLLPILWSHGAGADVMKRIAVPMVGGVITSFILELLIYPAIYRLWRGRKITS